ncbi:MAG TPA: hypothetical protein VFB54_14070 [Burkholderiales bacterium]|nr:hypothetical protein [Burkholderiales bacterium]
MDAVRPGIPIDNTPRFRWTPLDSAGGTIALGLALTALIVALLRLLQ